MKQHIDIEFFKHSEDEYYISDLGNVYSNKSGKIIKSHINHWGYITYGFWIDGAHKVRMAHRLVAQAFIPNPLDKPHINHINGIKSDNSITNLEWCTPKENSEHAKATGLLKFRKGLSASVECSHCGISFDKRQHLIDANIRRGSVNHYCSPQHMKLHRLQGGQIKVSDMAKKLKNIKLEEEVLKDLFKQALEAGYNNLQNYLEYVLIEQSKK